MQLLPTNGDPATVAIYAAAILAFAVLTAWPAPCANNPIFAEIVPVSQRNLVYSFDRCFEGAIAAFATPLVGILSERLYGFSGASTVTGDPEKDLPNARALGNALVAFLVIPWTLCLITYSGLHWTYPKDRRKALMLSRKLSEGALFDGEAFLEGRGAVTADGGAGGSRVTAFRLPRQGSYSAEQAPLTGSPPV